MANKALRLKDQSGHEILVIVSNIKYIRKIDGYLNPQRSTIVFKPSVSFPLMNPMGQTIYEYGGEEEVTVEHTIDELEKMINGNGLERALNYAGDCEE